MDTPTLSYDVTFEYMLKMDAKTLQNACSVSKMHAEICSNNSFWIQKINRDFPDINGHYDVEKAKKAWVLCTIGHKFVLNLYMQVKLFNQSFDVVDEFNTKFPKDEKAYQYLSNFINKNTIETVKQNYWFKMNRIYEDATCEHIDISNDMIFYIKNDTVTLYLRRSKSRQYNGIKRFTETEKEVILLVLKDYIFHSITEDDNVEMFKDVSLYYNNDGFQISEKKFMSNQNDGFVIIEAKNPIATILKENYPTLIESRERLSMKALDEIESLR